MNGTHEFVERFEAAWKEPRTKFVELFHPEGTLIQSGMERAIGRDAIPAHQELSLTLMPDLAIKARRWGANGDDVFFEWDAAGSFQGIRAEWSGISRFTLRDGLIIEEIACFDSLPLRAAADPTLGRRDMMSVAIEAAGGAPVGGS